MFQKSAFPKTGCLHFFYRVCGLCFRVILLLLFWFYCHAFLLCKHTNVGLWCVCVRVLQTDKCDWAQKILKFCILFYILISFLFLIFMGAKFDLFESDVEQTQYYMSLKHCRCKWVIKYLWIINIKWGLFMFNVDCWR